ncbi:MAG: class II aldolase/adducin family protein [Cyclobacteriaceae bacterium]|nr:class II aldolase/adducin family protein [Cyclobacteriaceae bacterium]
MHKPSFEFPFHKAIYDARPGIRSVIHAHLRLWFHLVS